MPRESDKFNVAIVVNIEVAKMLDELLPKLFPAAYLDLQKTEMPKGHFKYLLNLNPMECSQLDYALTFLLGNAISPGFSDN